MVNPLTTNVSHHVETSQLIRSANQLTGFYMMGNTGLNELMKNFMFYKTLKPKCMKV